MSNIFQQAPPEYLYQVGILNKFHELSRTDSRTGPVVDAALHSITLPANSLITDGQRAVVRGRGQNSGNIGAKTLTARWNTTTLITASLPAVAAAVIYTIEFEIIRITNTVVTIQVEVKHGYSFAGSALTLALTGATTSPSVNPLNRNDQLLEFLVSVPNADNVTMSTSFGYVL